MLLLAYVRLAQRAWGGPEPVGNHGKGSDCARQVCDGSHRFRAFTIITMFTGVHPGPVEFAIGTLQERPEAASPTWEDIHEVSLTLPEGRAYFNTPTDWEMKDIGDVAGDESGSYRARLHTAGRDAAFDLVVDAPTRVDLAGGSHDAHLDAFDLWIEALTAFLDVR